MPDLSRLRGLLLGAALLLPTRELRAEGAFIASSLPERAGTPVAYVDGHRFPIVSFELGQPIIQREGKTAAPRDAPISIVAGGRFAEGNLTVDQAETDQYTLKGNSNVVLSARTEFAAKLVSDRDRADVFLILLVYEDRGAGTYTDLPKIALLGSSIGRLSAGTSHRVHMGFPPLNSAYPLRWAALFFDRGVQIHTDGVPVLNAFFDVEDHIGLERAIGQRQSGDHPLAVYRGFPLSFTPGQKARFAGRTLNVHAFVSPSGTFDYVQEDELVDHQFAVFLATQLNYWLFLPRVKDGVPIEGPILLPLKF